MLILVLLHQQGVQEVYLQIEIDTLKKLVLKITGTPYSVNSIFFKYSSFTINGKYYRSPANPSKHPAVALASWDENLYGSATQIPSLASSILRPVHVFYFMKVTFTHGQTNHSIWTGIIFTNY